MTRQCECGCGEPLKGTRARRFVDNAHRMRARKARIAAGSRTGDDAPRGDSSAPLAGGGAAAGGIPADRPAPSNGSMGRTRAGLEVWISKQIDLPEMLVEAARSLADQVDRDPDRSPLWGRYLDALRQLQEPEQRATAWNDEVRRLYEVLLIGRADEEWRHEKHMQAIERGDPLADVWQRVVPIACARGRHSWKPHPDYWGAVRCQHCDTEQAAP
jgi:hypothetical protein